MLQRVNRFNECAIKIIITKIDVGGDQKHKVLLEWPYHPKIDSTSNLLCANMVYQKVAGSITTGELIKGLFSTSHCHRVIVW